MLIKCTNETKILRERTDNAHKGTLQGHGNRSSWSGKKLFSSYYSKVAYKMEKDTGLPGGPQLRGGRRGALIQEDYLFDIMT